MLTDTYTVDVFFREFLSDSDRASRWNALRHDSGDPIEFARQARKTWDEIARKRGEEDQVGKVGRVIFSDGLDVDEALRIWRECEKIGISGMCPRWLSLQICFLLTGHSSCLTASFGIGTHLTNDFHMIDDPNTKSKPLNMVIKLRKMDGMECVKLSDDRGKWTGDKGEVQRCRRILGLGGDEPEDGQEAPGTT
jgi:nicotinate phosphoribosyltransferase